jgi:hypothetical protein
MWPLLVRWRLDLTRIWLRIFIFLHTLSEVSKGTPDFRTVLYTGVVASCGSHVVLEKSCSVEDQTSTKVSL